MKAKGKSRCSPIAFPAAARRMDTLNDLLAESDLVSLHCSLSDDTMQIPNAECLQHVKPGNCDIPKWSLLFPSFKLFFLELFAFLFLLKLVEII